jgi:uncharacterized surface protein with fasciclin (FAS1) repeats
VLVAASICVDARSIAAKDLMDTMIDAGSFCTLLGAVRTAGLEENLRGPGPYTLFAPDDAAFAALPRQTLADLMKPENRPQLVAMIRGYLVPSRILARDLAGKRRWVATIDGRLLMIDGTRGTLMIDDDVEVLAADMISDNGVMHIIDTVLLEN